MTSEVWERIAETAELGDRERLSVIIDDTPALLIRSGEGLYAIEDVCTHDGQPLTDGEIVDGSIECPRHGARFDIKTGSVLCMPATEPIRTFQVEVRGESIYARPQPVAGETEAGEMPAAELANSAAVAGSREVQPVPAAVSNPFLQAPGEGDMLEALKQVIDPELFVNIVDLGLVYDISKSEANENDVIVTMTLTSPACPAGPQIVSQSRSVLEKLPGVNTAEIKLTMSPPWTPEMMTDEARDQLGIF